MHIAYMHIAYMPLVYYVVHAMPRAACCSPVGRELIASVSHLRKPPVRLSGPSALGGGLLALPCKLLVEHMLLAACVCMIGDWEWVGRWGVGRAFG